jgi:hypothetical protein
MEKRRVGMLVKKTPDIKSSEITDKKLYINRRQFIVGSAALATWRLLSPASLPEPQSKTEKKLSVAKRGEYTVPEKLTPYDEAREANARP